MDRLNSILLLSAISCSIIAAILFYIILPYYQRIVDELLLIYIERELTEEENHTLNLIPKLMRMTRRFVYVLILISLIAVSIVVVTFRIP